MQLDKVLEKRISVRHFSDKEVTVDEIKEIINAGRLSPSAKNRQPYLYVLVNNKQKQLLAEKMKQMDPMVEPTILDSARITREANKFVMVFCDYSNDNPKGDLLSIGASIENCLLKATELKIDSLWCRDIVAIKDFVYKYFKIDGRRYTLESAICFGYRSSQPYRKQKKTLEDILIIND